MRDSLARICPSTMSAPASPAKKQQQQQQQQQQPPYSSLSRVSHIPIVECGISTLHSTLATMPLLRTPYALSLSLSSSLSPYLESASTHFPFAPFLAYGDRAANKGLDIAQEKWPYPFKSKPEQVWNDVRSVADSRVVQPAFSMAKSVDQVHYYLSHTLLPSNATLFPPFSLSHLWSTRSHL
jgi:hypothetical protein